MKDAIKKIDNEGQKYIRNVSNAVYIAVLINSVFRELRHDFAMHIILRPGVSN